MADNMRFSSYLVSPWQPVSLWGLFFGFCLSNNNILFSWEYCKWDSNQSEVKKKQTGCLVIFGKFKYENNVHQGIFPKVLKNKDKDEDYYESRH